MFTTSLIKQTYKITQFSQNHTKHKKYVYYASASYANIKMNKAIDDYSRESTHLTNFVGVDVIPL